MVGDSQCFPLKLYEKAENLNGELYKNQYGEDDYVEKDGISDAGFEHFQKAYPKKKSLRKMYFTIFTVCYTQKITVIATPII